MCRMRIRVPGQWWGDYLAVLGAARIGERRLLELGSEFGWDALGRFAEPWLAYSERRMANAIARLPSGRATVTTIPGVEAAVMLHCGSPADSDQTYGALGTIVAERAIGIEGPLREYFLVPFTEPDLSRHRTEICWPVFQTA